MSAGDAAYWAIIAIGFVLIGAILVTPLLTIEQRGTVLGGIIASLAWVAWRHRKHREE